MTRTERSEYTYMKNMFKKYEVSDLLSATIRTDGGHEYKQALHELYMAHGLRPSSIRVDRHMYDDKERIIYIKAHDYELNGKTMHWDSLYTEYELAAFANALK